MLVGSLPLRSSSAPPSNAMAQALKDVQTADTPLVLKAQGSFFVGGEKVEQTRSEVGDLGSRGAHHRQPDVRALHGAAGRRRQRSRRHGSWRDPDGQVLGDDAGRTHGLGRVLRPQGPSRVRPRPGRARAIGLQSGRLQQRARGLGAAGQASRAGCDSATRASGPTSASAWQPGQPFSDSQFPVSAVDELSKQGVPDVSLAAASPTPTRRSRRCRSRRSVEWRGVDGALAVGLVPAGGGAAQSRRRERSRARRAGSCPANVHRRADRHAGEGADPGRVRRSPRHADRPSRAAHMAGPLRGLPGHDRPHQGRRRSGRDAQPAEIVAFAATAT